MVTPPGQLTLPTLPSFPSIFAQPSAFSSGQQSTLQTLANALGGFSQSLITSGAQDLFNAEQTLAGSSLTLNQFISEISSLIPVFTPSNVSNLSAFLTSSNLSAFLSQILSSSTIVSNLATLGSNSSFITSLPTLVSLATNANISSFISGILSSGSIISVLASFGGGPTAYFQGLFNSGNIYNNVTPQNLIAGLLFPPSSSSFPSIKLTGVSGSPTANNWALILSALGSTSAAGNSTPQQLLYDIFVNAGNVPKDLEAILAPSFGTWFYGLFPTTNIGPTNSSPQQFIYWMLTNPSAIPGWITQLFPNTNSVINGVIPQQVFTDLFSNPQNAPLDFLNMVNTSILGINFPGSSGAKLFGNYLVNILQNITQLTENIWLGSPEGTSTIGVSIPQVGGSSYTGDFVYWSGSGYYSSIAPPNVPSMFTTSPGTPGWIGATLAQVMAAAGGLAYIINNGFISSAAGGNFAAQVNIFEHAILDNLLLARALINTITMVGQLMTMVQNIGNILQQSVIPTSPSAFFSSFPYLGQTGPSWNGLF